MGESWANQRELVELVGRLGEGALELLRAIVRCDDEGAADLLARLLVDARPPAERPTP